MELSRRDLMKYGVLGSAALLLPLERAARTQLLINDRMPTSGLPKPYTLPFQTPPVAVPYKREGNTDFYSMHMLAQKVPVLGPGKPSTLIFGYARTDAAGNTLAPTTPGPTIQVERGRRVAVRHCQELPAIHPDQRYPTTTSVHLHGSASLPQYDGYASDVTGTSQFKDYFYPNLQDSRTLWYHDHGIHHTANNAYMGLAAQYHLHDDLERSLGIPVGEPYDVPLIVRDAMFAKSGDLIYDDHSESGIYGDVILVNGVPWPNMKVERRKYRFRILNAGVSRSYKWRLSTGDPFTVIGTDGGLMNQPQTVGSFRHGMAERYEVVIDFSKYKIGQKIELLNDSPPNNIDYDTIKKVMQFEVVKDAVLVNGKVPNNSVTLPAQRQLRRHGPQRRMTRRRRASSSSSARTATGPSTARRGRRSSRAATSTRWPTPSVGDIEVWELENTSGGWFHPVHIHLIDFRVLWRNGDRRKGHAARAGSEGRRLRRRGREGPRDHEVRRHARPPRRPGDPRGRLRQAQGRRPALPGRAGPRRWPRAPAST